MSPQKKFVIEAQPNDTTCGPTCLHAVYNHFGDQLDLKSLISDVRALKDGGTLAVLLGVDALKRGYKAHLYSYNLRVFDPTWARLSMSSLRQKLELSLQYHTKPKLHLAIRSYLEFLDLGGVIKFDELTPELLRTYLEKKNPVLTGLSSTYLYKSIREFGPNSEEDDIRGEPAGHFVVLYDYDDLLQKVYLADPWAKNPIDPSRYYKVNIRRLINSILLGVLTYDANLLILSPPPSNKKKEKISTHD